MPLLEIVVGEQTSDAAIAKAIDVALQIKKTPIVVNDSRGFFTSRVIGTFMGEAAAMLGEGVPAPSIEQAALQAGYPTGPLALFDEVSLTLARRIREAGRRAAKAEGWEFAEHPSFPLIDTMVVELERGGRAAGAGFYDYVDGKQPDWSGLAERWGGDVDPQSISFTELQERMLFVEALDSVRCLDEGVLRSVPEANIGSIFGIGFPPWTGGVLQYINGYEGGLPGFVERANELAAKYGDRFTPPQSLIEKAAAGTIASDRHPGTCKPRPRRRSRAQLRCCARLLCVGPRFAVPGRSAGVAGGLSPGDAGAGRGRGLAGARVLRALVRVVAPPALVQFALLRGERRGVPPTGTPSRRVPQRCARYGVRWRTRGRRRQGPADPGEGVPNASNRSALRLFFCFPFRGRRSSGLDRPLAPIHRPVLVAALANQLVQVEQPFLVQFRQLGGLGLGQQQPVLLVQGVDQRAVRDRQASDPGSTARPSRSRSAPGTANLGARARKSGPGDVPRPRIAVAAEVCRSPGGRQRSARIRADFVGQTVGDRRGGDRTTAPGLSGSVRPPGRASLLVLRPDPLEEPPGCLPISNQRDPDGSQQFRGFVELVSGEGASLLETIPGSVCRARSPSIRIARYSASARGWPAFGSWKSGTTTSDSESERVGSTKMRITRSVCTLRR